MANYYYRAGEVTKGPFNLAEMEVLVRTHQITAESFICPEGSKRWVQSGEISEIAALLPAVRKEAKGEPLTWNNLHLHRQIKASPVHQTDKHYTTPILTIVYSFVAVLALAGAGVAVLVGNGGMSLVVVAIFCAGFAQMVAFMGRTAFHTERMADLLNQQQGRSARSDSAVLTDREPIMPS